MKNTVNQKTDPRLYRIEQEKKQKKVMTVLGVVTLIVVIAATLAILGTALFRDYFEKLSGDRISDTGLVGSWSAIDNPAIKITIEPSDKDKFTGIFISYNVTASGTPVENSRYSFTSRDSRIYVGISKTEAKTYIYKLQSDNTQLALTNETGKTFIFVRDKAAQ